MIFFHIQGHSRCLALMLLHSNITTRHLECPVWEKNHSLTGARTRKFRFRAHALSNCATRIGKNFNLKNYYICDACRPPKNVIFN